MNKKNLKEFDNEVATAIAEELNRQRTHIELIASENFVSRAVLEAQGSVLTNKYAEGYSGKRYYGGCEFVDVVETIAIERVCKLFNAKFANVQPHSGASANLAAYNAILMPGDKIICYDFSRMYANLLGFNIEPLIYDSFYCIPKLVTNEKLKDYAVLERKWLVDKQQAINENIIKVFSEDI